MPMMYKQRIYSRRYNDHDAYYKQMNPRNLLMEFIHHDGVGWFIEQGIPLSIETYKVIETMQTQADMFASFTYEQLELWREKKIIDKLQNSYNTNMSKEDYPF